MIEPIVIKVVDKVPIVVSGPQYVVCDNSDYTVVWQLDEEWVQFESRTMQVNYKDGTYERVLFTGNTCALPALPVPGPVHVGLFAGDIHTTRPARLLAVRSATTDSGEERDSMPNGYAQAIKALDGKLDKNQGAENAGKALVVGDDGNVVPGEAQGGGSLPAMSSDTKGKMLTNDGDKAEWGGAVRYDVEQGMLGGEQLQARKNIDAFPGKTLQYFFDTTAGSKHDNDISAAYAYDVIAPGNIYTNGTISNKGMVFPLYILQVNEVSSRTYRVRAIDANGVAWETVYSRWTGTDEKTHVSIYSISRVVTETMRVNFTQDDNDNWSADKNWDDAAALIDAGGYVYATRDGVVIPFIRYSAEEQIAFQALIPSPFAVGTSTIYWNQDGTIEFFNTPLPVVMYGEQELAEDQQAQARKNIGAGTSSFSGSYNDLEDKPTIPTIPAALPNPNALTIKVGDTTTTYDGSAAKTVTIPTGDSSGGETWEQIVDLTTSEDTNVIQITEGLSHFTKLWIEIYTFATEASQTMVFANGANSSYFSLARIGYHVKGGRMLAGYIETLPNGFTGGMSMIKFFNNGSDANTPIPTRNLDGVWDEVSFVQTDNNNSKFPINSLQIFENAGVMKAGTRVFVYGVKS